VPGIEVRAAAAALALEGIARIIGHELLHA